MENIKSILERLQILYKAPNNRQLAEKMNVNYNTLNTWIKRESIPYELLHGIVQNENISMDWLFRGKGEMRPITVNRDDSTKDNSSNKTIGNNNNILNGNININTSEFNHGADIKEIIDLLQYAPSEFLNILKERLKKFKELTHL